MQANNFEGWNEVTSFRNGWRLPIEEMGYCCNRLNIYTIIQVSVREDIVS